MNVFSSMSLRTKLVGGFVLVSVLAGLIGAVSYWGIHGISQNLLTISNNCMPSIRSLMEVRLGGEKTKVIGRTLLNLDCDIDVRKKQYSDLTTARESYGQSWKLYETLKHSPEEQQLWTEFAAPGTLSETPTTSLCECPMKWTRCKSAIRARSASAWRQLGSITIEFAVKPSKCLPRKNMRKRTEVR